MTGRNVVKNSDLLIPFADGMKALMVINFASKQQLKAIKPLDYPFSSSHSSNIKLLSLVVSAAYFSSLNNSLFLSAVIHTKVLGMPFCTWDLPLCPLHVLATVGTPNTALQYWLFKIWIFRTYF